MPRQYVLEMHEREVSDEKYISIVQNMIKGANPR